MERRRLETNTVLDYQLTPREEEVLSLILQGNTNRGIGSLLGISPRTVEVHRLHIMSKIHATNVVDLCIRCRDWKPRQRADAEMSMAS
nr:helix-turn-helix transcriptional regulator [uncultured Devosia sp.]